MRYTFFLLYKWTIIVSVILNFIFFFILKDINVTKGTQSATGDLKIKQSELGMVLINDECHI